MSAHRMTRHTSVSALSVAQIAANASPGVDVGARRSRRHARTLDVPLDELFVAWQVTRPNVWA